MNIFQKNKGAVSVFLALILVPTILITSIFVDVGRVYLSRNLVDSAADLALNSVLTRYDRDLFDWYGLMGSTQNIDKTFEKSEKSFKKSLISNDSKSKDSKNFLKAEILNSEKIISKIDNANLSNPAMIKKEIVEFSKYRAPVELVENLITRFNDLEGFSSFIKNADKDKDLIDAKRKFYETESEFLKKAFNLYSKLREYNEISKKYTIKKFEELKIKLKDIEAVYSKIHENTYKVYMFISEGVEKYSKADFDKKASDLKVKSERDNIETSSIKNMIENDGGKLSLDQNAFNKLVKDFRKSLNLIRSYVERISEILSDIDEVSPGKKDNELNIFYWWSKALDAYEINRKLKKEINIFKGLYVKTKLTDKLEVKGGNEDSKKQYYLAMKEYREYEDFLAYNEKGRKYKKYSKLLENISNDAENRERIKTNRSIIRYNGKTVTYNEALSDISRTIKDYRTDIEKMNKVLYIVIHGGRGDSIFTSNDNIPSLDELLKLVKKYQEDFKDWNKKANSNTSEIAKTDKEEIRKRVEKEFVNKVTEENVEEFKERVTNIKSVLDDVLESLKGYSYNNKDVKDIKDYNMFKGEFYQKIDKKSVRKKNIEMEEDYKLTFSLMFKKAEKTFDLEDVKKPTHNPLVDPEEDKYNIPKLYKYMYNVLEEAYLQKDRVKEENDKFKGATDKEKELEKKTDEKNRFHGSKTSIKKEFSSDSKYGNFNIFKGLVTSLVDIMSGNLGNIRDDIYTVTYAMNMFSFATYDNEGRFKLASEREQRAFSLKPDYSKQDKLWKEFDIFTAGASGETARKIRFKNRTMTGVRINKENNQAYLSELEYILKGELENSKNVSGVYKDIRNIRYNLNLISAFQLFWTVNSLDFVSRFIQAITYGFVPASLVKIIVLSILTLAETAYDLDRLEAGFPIEPYKGKKENWKYLIPKADNLPTLIAGILEGSGKKENSTKGLYYSDYVTIFLLSYLKNHSSDGYKRIAEIIQTNIGGKTGKEGYSLSNSNIYYKLNAKVKLAPILFSLNMFRDYVDGKSIRKDWNTYDIEIIRGY